RSRIRAYFSIGNRCPTGSGIVYRALVQAWTATSAVRRSAAAPAESDLHGMAFTVAKKHDGDAVTRLMSVERVAVGIEVLHRGPTQFDDHVPGRESRRVGRRTGPHAADAHAVHTARGHVGHGAEIRLRARAGRGGCRHRRTYEGESFGPIAQGP